MVGRVYRLNRYIFSVIIFVQLTQANAPAVAYGLPETAIHEGYVPHNYQKHGRGLGCAFDRAEFLESASAGLSLSLRSFDHEKNGVGVVRRANAQRPYQLASANMS